MGRGGYHALVGFATRGPVGTTIGTDDAETADWRLGVDTEPRNEPELNGGRLARDATFPSTPRLPIPDASSGRSAPSASSQFRPARARRTEWTGGVLRSSSRVRRCRVLRVPPDGTTKPAPRWHKTLSACARMMIFESDPD